MNGDIVLFNDESGAIIPLLVMKSWAGMKGEQRVNGWAFGEYGMRYVQSVSEGAGVNQWQPKQPAAESAQPAMGASSMTSGSMVTPSGSSIAEETSSGSRRKSHKASSTTPSES